MTDSYEEMGAATVQLMLKNSKFEEGQGDYSDETQKLFKTMRVRAVRYEFLKVLRQQGLVREFDLRNVFSEGFYGVDLLSVKVIESEMCL